MTASRFAIVLSFVAGLSAAAQAAISGVFGRRIGTIPAASFGAVAGALLLLTLAFAHGRGGGLLSGIHQPPWLWLIGPLGAGIVVVLAYAPPLIGTFATVALMIAGQLVAGALIDAFGLLGTPRIPLTASRAAGLMLVATGAAFTLKR